MEKTINSIKPEKKTTGRINLADVMVLLLCVVCIVGLVLRFGVLNTIETNATSEAASVTVLIEDIAGTSKDYILLGDEVYLSESGLRFGTVSSILSVSPSSYYEYRDDGSINQMQSVNGRIDVRVVISVEGCMTESGFLLDGTTYIAPNMTLSLNSSSLSVTALITDLQTAEK